MGLDLTLKRSEEKLHAFSDTECSTHMHTKTQCAKKMQPRFAATALRAAAELPLCCVFGLCRMQLVVNTQRPALLGGLGGKAMYIGGSAGGPEAAVTSRCKTYHRDAQGCAEPLEVHLLDVPNNSCQDQDTKAITPITPVLPHKD